MQKKKKAKKVTQKDDNSASLQISASHRTFCAEFEGWTANAEPDWTYKREGGLLK